MRPEHHRNLAGLSWGKIEIQEVPGAGRSVNDSRVRGRRLAGGREVGREKEDREQ